MRVILNTGPLLFTKTGIGHYVWNLYEGLLTRREVEVYPTVVPASDSSLGLMRRCAGGLEKVVGTRAKESLSSLCGRVLRITGKRNALPPGDVYHETQFDPIPPGRWKRIANIYDLSYLLFPEYLPPESIRRCRLHLNTLSQADAVIVNTGAIRQEAADLLDIPLSRIFVIPLAPSIKFSGESAREGPAPVRSGESKPYILFVGTIEPRKNIPVLLRAFRIVRQRHDVSLVIAGGKGWSCDPILTMPADLGMGSDVIFTGYVDDDNLAGLYRGATALVNPSLYEGFGIPLVEAMSLGIPVIASDIPTFREVAGDAALFFHPGDHEELADRLDNMLSSEAIWTSLKEKSLRRSASFSWQKVISLTVRTYRTIL